MRPLIRPALIGSAALIAMAGSAQAQSLSWPGKASAPTHPSAPDPASTSGVRPRAAVADVRMVPAASRAPARVETPLRGLRPAPLLPMYGAAAAPAAETYAPPPSAPQPMTRPAPVAPAPQPAARQPERLPERTPAPMPTAADTTGDPMAPRSDAPIFRMSQPAPQPAQPQPSPQPDADDPMAPRVDAPIYRMSQPQPAAQTQPEPVAQDAGSARYYSLHRGTGRQPDAAPRPEPVYLDALPVELIDPPKSEDMAAPPEPTRVLRDANGRIVQDPMAGDAW